MKSKDSFTIRRAIEDDVSVIDRYITEWLDLKISREESIKRAVKNKELLVANYDGKPIGFIHYVMHEDIIDGGPNSFIKAFYVDPKYRNKGVGSRLLRSAIDDALEKGVFGIETSTANPEARRLYEKHCFEQFMGKWTMGEVFLELNLSKYRSSFVTDRD